MVVVTIVSACDLVHDVIDNAFKRDGLLLALAFLGAHCLDDGSVVGHFVFADDDGEAAPLASAFFICDLKLPPAPRTTLRPESRHDSATRHASRLAASPLYATKTSTASSALPPAACIASSTRSMPSCAPCCINEGISLSTFLPTGVL